MAIFFAVGTTIWKFRTTNTRDLASTVASLVEMQLL